MLFLREKMAYKHGPEELEMFAFFDYCRLMSARDPKYSRCFHIPNENKSSIPRRVSLKRAGLKKGVPDICYPVPNDKYNHLYIEMKVKPNKPSQEQLTVIRELLADGSYAVICWSAEEAIDILEKYRRNQL